MKDAKTILRYTRKSIERAQIAAGQTPHLPTCGAQKAGSVHPADPLPTDREERNRRESARRHADIAEAQGKSAEEIHEISKGHERHRQVQQKIVIHRDANGAHIFP